MAVGSLGLCCLGAGPHASADPLPSVQSACDPWVEFWRTVLLLAAAGAPASDSLRAPPARSHTGSDHPSAPPGEENWNQGEMASWSSAEAESTTSETAPPAHPPAAVPDTYVVLAQQSLDVPAPGLLDNDSDADGDALSVMLEEPAERGSVEVGADGSFTYTPEPGFTGTDRFTYAVSDGSALALAVVTVTTQLPPAVTFSIHPCDDATIASSRANLTHGDATDLQVRRGATEQRSLLKFSVHGLGLVVDRARLRLHCLDAGPEGGTLQRVASEYRGTGEPWTQAGLSWNNAPVPDAVPLGFLGAVTAGSWVEIDLTDVIQRDGVYGFELLHGGPNLVTYGARESRNPPQLLITTRICSEAGNAAPVVADDTYTLEAGGSLECPAPGLLENDRDGDGDELVLVSSRSPTHGALRVSADGSFTYAPDPGYFGPDSFTYCAADGRGGLATGTVVLEIAPVDLGFGPEPEAQKPGPPEMASPGMDPTRIFPNPCRGNTWIEYSLPQGGWVEAAIYDARGHLVRLLVAGPKPAGRQQVDWDGANQQGAALPSGIYFSRLLLGDSVQRHKIVLQR